MSQTSAPKMSLKYSTGDCVKPNKTVCIGPRATKKCVYFDKNLSKDDQNLIGRDMLCVGIEKVAFGRPYYGYRHYECAIPDWFVGQDTSIIEGFLSLSLEDRTIIRDRIDGAAAEILAIQAEKDRVKGEKKRAADAKKLEKEEKRDAKRLKTPITLREE